MLSTIRRDSTREEKCCLLLAIEMKARIVVGTGLKGPLCDPGSELLLGERARVSARKIGGMENKMPSGLRAERVIIMMYCTGGTQVIPTVAFRVAPHYFEEARVTKTIGSKTATPASQQASALLHLPSETRVWPKQLLLL